MDLATPAQVSVEEWWNQVVFVAGLWTMFIGEEGHSTKIEITGFHVMALRQMAYELLNSPDLVSLAA